MKKIILSIIIASLVTACEPSHHEQKKEEAKPPVEEQKPAQTSKAQSSPSFGEHLATEAVTGAVGGAAVGAGHAVANHAIDGFKKRRMETRSMRNRGKYK